MSHTDALAALGGIQAVLATLIGGGTITQAELDDLKGLLSTASSAVMNAEGTQGMLQGGVAAVKTVIDGHASATNSTLAIAAATANAEASGISGGITSLANGTTALANGAAQVSTGTNQLAGGLAQLSTGGDALSSGAEQLASGGGDQLAAGIGQLAGGADQLAGGVQQLAAGSIELAGGRLSAKRRNEQAQRWKWEASSRHRAAREWHAQPRPGRSRDACARAARRHRACVGRDRARPSKHARSSTYCGRLGADRQKGCPVLR